MSVASDAAQSRGDIMREIADLKRQVQALQTARRLEAASVGRGGIRVRGGRIVIEDESGAETFVAASDGLALIGSLDVLEGGNIVAHHPDGSEGVILGLFRVGGDAETDRGISVQTDDSVPGAGIFGNANIFAAWQRSDGLRRVHAGELGNPIEEFICRADDSVMVGDRVTIRAGGGTGLILGLDPPAGIGILVQPGGLFVNTVDTTASSANVNIDGVGRLAIVTSSARHKQDIEDLRVDAEQVLKLRPRTWRDRTEVQREPDTDRWHVGLVAEEVDAAGLHQFVDYDEDGNPESVTYDRLVVALLEVVGQLQARLDALDGGVERQPATGRKPRRRRSDSAQPPPVRQ